MYCHSLQENWSSSHNTDWQYNSVAQRAVVSIAGT
jgi:hypothetical protein